MKTLQKGFTLIELMIVVAIIGILAAIAVPAYQDYTLRSKASEAASLMGATRTAVDVAYSDGYQLSDMPPRTSLGISNSASYQGRYVYYVTYNDRNNGADGKITVKMLNIPELGPVKNTTVIWSPNAVGGTIQWTVATSSTMPGKYRPK